MKCFLYIFVACVFLSPLTSQASHATIRTEAEVEAAAKNPDITSIEIIASQELRNKSDWLFESLAQLPSLSQLKMAYFGMTYGGFAKINLLQNLTELSLPNTLFYDPDYEQLKPLHELPLLRSLDFSWCRGLYTKGLGVLITIPTLEELNVSFMGRVKLDYWSRHEIELPVVTNPNLLRLDMSSVVLKSLNFDAVAPNLKWLNLSNWDAPSTTPATQFHLASFVDLTRSQKLEELLLHGVIFTEENIEQMGLATLSSLRVLDLSDSNARGILYHIFCPNLEHLNLGGSKVSTKDVGSISQLQNLEVLLLNDTKVSGTCIKKMSKLLSLQRLSLANTEIRDCQFTALVNLPMLEVLNLSNTRLSVTDFQQLSQLKQLKLLDVRNIRNTNINAEMVETLRKELPECEVLY